MNNASVEHGKMFKRLAPGQKETWIGIPGVGSFGASFEPLAKMLAVSDIGFIAIETMEIFKREPLLDSIDQFVDLIMREIDSLQLDDPFTIVGHSFGGRVAYSLAGRLELLVSRLKIIMIDALPKNLNDSIVLAEKDLTIESILRWYISTFPKDFAKQFDDISDTELRDALVALRVIRFADVASFTDSVKRQILAHHRFLPKSLTSKITTIDVLLASDGFFASADRSQITKLMEETACRWTIRTGVGDHYSILKQPSEILREFAEL
jgi:thioesterase domain-containing protein